jgi:hypothetical protein
LAWRIARTAQNCRSASCHSIRSTSGADWPGRLSQSRVNFMWSAALGPLFSLNHFRKSKLDVGSGKEQHGNIRAVSFLAASPGNETQSAAFSHQSVARTPPIPRHPSPSHAGWKYGAGQRQCRLRAFSITSLTEQSENCFLANSVVFVSFCSRQATAGRAFISGAPKILKSLLAQFRVAGGVLDRAMTEPILHCSRVMPCIG